MKEIRVFADNLRAVLGVKGIIAMFLTAAGVYITMIMTCVIFG